MSILKLAMFEFELAQTKLPLFNQEVIDQCQTRDTPDSNVERNGLNVTSKDSSSNTIPSSQTNFGKIWRRSGRPLFKLF